MEASSSPPSPVFVSSAAGEEWVGAASPSFAAPLWDGCVERLREEANEHALHLARQKEVARQDVIIQLQHVPQRIPP